MPLMSDCGAVSSCWWSIFWKSLSLAMVATSSRHRDYHLAAAVPAAWLLSVLHNLSSVLSKSTDFILSFDESESLSAGHR